MTVATSYEGIVAKHLADHGIDASVVHLDGAVETAIELGVAEVIADVVETGTSLRNAGLEVFGEPIMKSEAVVIRRTGADADEDEPKVQQFLRRLQGVLVARTLRDDGLRLPRRAAGEGRRPHPGPGVADRLPAAQRGLGRRPRHGPGQGGPADHGRPVRPRRPRHPDHGHPRLPPLTAGRDDRTTMSGPVRRSPALPVTFRPGRTRAVLLTAGRRDLRRHHRGRAAAATRSARGSGSASSSPPRCSAGVLVLLCRPKVVADESGVTVVNITSRRRLAWAEILQVNLRPGDPWVFLDLSDGTSLPALGIQPGIARQRAIARRPRRCGPSPRRTPHPRPGRRATTEQSGLTRGRRTLPHRPMS